MKKAMWLLLLVMGLFVGSVQQAAANDGDEANFTVISVVDSYTDELIVVATIPFTITEDTEIIGEVAVGDYAIIEAVASDDGLFTALAITRIEAPEALIFVRDFVEAYDETSLTVDGRTFIIDENTTVYGEISVGDLVFLSAIDNGDGTFTAEHIEVLDSTPPPPFNAPVSVFGEVTAYDSSSITVDGMYVFVISAETLITGDVEIGSIVFVTGTPQDDGSVVADFINAPSGFLDFGIAIGEITAVTDTSFTIDDTLVTLTDESNVEGTPEVGLYAIAIGMRDSDSGALVALEAVIFDLNIEGVIESISAGSITVDGQVFEMNQQTKVSGDLTVGTTVNVSYESLATRQAGPTARFISVVDSTSAPTAVALNAVSSTVPSAATFIVLAATILLIGASQIVLRKQR